MPEPDRCSSSPEGESHRWRIPNQGDAGPSRCKHCGNERTFATDPDASRSDARSSQAGIVAARRARYAARKATP